MDSPDAAMKHVLTAAQITTLGAHMILASQIDSPIVCHYEIKDPAGLYMSMAIRKNGKSFIAMLFEPSNLIMVLEILVDQENQDVSTRRHVLTIPNEELTDDCWDDILDQMHDWAEGNRDDIILGEGAEKKD
jgi:hypothetical protein